MKEIDHEYTNEIVCPHCGYELGDSWEYPDVSSKETCPSCYKQFAYEREIEITYSSNKI